MKLLQRNEAEVIFQLGVREYEAFQRLLALYPMVPEGYSQLSRFSDPKELGADEELLKESLAESKRSGQKAIQEMFADGRHFEHVSRAWLLKLLPGEVEWLLQVCGDIRVGSWIKLGSPNNQQERALKLTPENLDYFLPLQMMSNLQLLFINSLRDPAEADANLLEIKLFDRQQVLPWVLKPEVKFPSLAHSYVDFGSPGLIAVGGELTVERLKEAYSAGIFPWSVKPVTWWSPVKRGIFEFDQFRIPERLQRILRQKKFKVTANQAFREVIEGCATARRKGNWIAPEMIEAYTALHKAGHAHSVECWEDGKLAGGIYGVAIGGLFAAESMFFKASNASKVALVHLVEALKRSGFTLLDIQMVTPTTAAFGAVEITRREYLARLGKAVDLPVKFTFPANQE
ncbi:MAG: Leucyl/phenylalanyl-tRNA--protein transferase [Verrucomicrobia bacterium]|nr:Leucyl/phenylalanyl-tRNA--protein transferase [Verrucomicrobiota bacterium]